MLGWGNFGVSAKPAMHRIERALEHFRRLLQRLGSERMILPARARGEQFEFGMDLVRRCGNLQLPFPPDPCDLLQHVQETSGRPWLESGGK